MTALLDIQRETTLYVFLFFLFDEFVKSIQCFKTGGKKLVLDGS